MTGIVTAPAEQPFKFATTPGKLPKNVVPRHYALRLQPDLATFTTKGTEVIDLEVLAPANEIVLNALDMEITQAALTSPKNIPLRPRENAGEQTVTFTLPETLAPGKYTLALEFTGHLREQAQGLFYIRYAAKTGKKLMLCTQMEPADARRMFPCWDEPSFRASFEPTVIVPEKHVTISNMPVQDEKPLGGGLKAVHFEPTPPMASYLVVLVSGELEVLEDSFEGVQMRIVTTEGKREQARYALESAKKILGYYNDYFGVKFPLPKLDQIAVPGGFSGAMENWGGITYNESTLLFNPKSSSLETKRRVFSVMAHEMAHQWFGDLVTTAWWDNLWLNEGFASWMGTKCTDHFNPEWDMWLGAGSEKSGVMRTDSMRSTHPILQPVLDESQANDAFDNITYIKGQSFLRMLENYLGESTFRAGLRLYIASHAYSNTTTADLWSALEKVSGKPVSVLSAGWTEQPGLPVINVSSQCVNGQDIVTLQQERFTVQDPGAAPLQWKVPVSLADVTRPGSARVVLLEGKTATVAFPDCDAVIKANFGDAGYYRVSYSPEMFDQIKQRITLLAPEDRLNLLGDVWAMVGAQRAAATDYLDLARLLRDEKSTAVWGDIIARLGYLDNLERGLPGRAAFRQLAIQLVHPQFTRLGWDAIPGEPATDALLRNDVINLLGDFGDPEVITGAQARFQQFLAQPDSLAPNLRSPVLYLAGRYADRATYDKLHDLARAAKGTEERRRYYGAMTAALDPALAALTLQISLTDETIPQEAIRLVAGVARDGEQPELAWQFAQAHMPELLDKAESFRRNSYVPSIMGEFSDASRADELENYVREHISPEAVTKARETAESIRLKAALKQRELPGVDRWVAAQQRPPLG